MKIVYSERITLYTWTEEKWDIGGSRNFDITKKKKKRENNCLTLLRVIFMKGGKNNLILTLKLVALGGWLSG